MWKGGNVGSLVWFEFFVGKDGWLFLGKLVELIFGVGVWLVIIVFKKIGKSWSLEINCKWIVFFKDDRVLFRGGIN